MAAEKEYALYKGDKLIGIGTATELAKQLNVKRSTIMYYTFPVYQRKLENRKYRNARVIVCLDDEGEAE